MISDGAGLATSRRRRPHRTYVTLKRAKLVYFSLVVGRDGENVLRRDWITTRKPLSRLDAFRIQ
ncbi:unnamed protein product [Mycetohabitans rhizoxinica HKI 454]|uniref:Uncharacterized protein n=1 Tax=Mycetohabitans rhizoxinica (strain DSM 19002 / CIP 109453 / HKI 454) TaxID=882378 RepID=E5APF8_MYCRK|nr:unnamed protein product [Mycetohabitans rhizoxinica HKI 454]